MPERHSIGLILAGVLQILIGIGSAIVLLYIASGSELAVRQGPAAGASVASSLTACGIATLYFFAAGAGSLMRRRWARALSVVVSGMWLAGGIVTAVLVLLVPDSTTLTAGAAIGAFVILPLILVFIYSRDSIRLECEAADVPRWTDRVPLPVLAVVIMLAFGALTLVANLANPVLALFSTRVTGAPAALALLGLAILCGWLAIQLYRLNETAWWTLVLLQILGCVAAAISLARGGIHRSGLFVAVIVATWVAYFAYLLFIRRYFALRLQPRTRRGDVAGDQFTFSG